MADSGHSVYDESGRLVATFQPGPSELEWAYGYRELKARHDELVAALREIISDASCSAYIAQLAEAALAKVGA